MIDQLAALIVDESKWLTASMGLALIAVAALLYRRRHPALSARRRVMAAMNLIHAARSPARITCALALLRSGAALTEPST